MERGNGDSDLDGVRGEKQREMEGLMKVYKAA